MIRNIILFVFAPLLLSCSSVRHNTDEQTPDRHPNIVIIYVDDLGYGDLGCYGATGVETPNIDRLAANGILFTDAHCSAATCTPSRYSLLAGSYAFRRNAAILPGDAPLLIRPGTPTLASMLKNAGYTTAVIGKWHLGLGNGKVDWNAEVKPGPLEIGFDYSFIIPSTGDRVPAVYLENYRVAGWEAEDPLYIQFTDDPSEGNPYPDPTGLSHPEMLKQPADTQHSGTITNRISRIGFMTGADNARFVDEDFLFVLSEKASDFMEENKDRPFFLYFAFHEIHVPRLPNEKFIGASSMGPRGDAIAQMDWVTGQLIEKLEELGIAENTLVFFSSDNGPVLNDGYEDQAVELLGNHKPAGPFRGGKYSIYEGGNRMPTITYWPGTIDHAVNDALWTQVDLFASLAALTSQEVPENAAPDSKDMLSVLLGKSEKGREIMLEEAFTFGLRKNAWKYIEPTDEDHAWIMEIKNIEGGVSTEPQLYNLETDPGETNNLAAEYPALVHEMDSILQSIKQ